MQKIKSSDLKEHWPFILYTLLILASFLFHEAWRDEMQALLIAKAPIGIKEFFTSTLHYEGHPFLWFYILKIFSPMGVSPFGLQLANSVFIIAAVAIFWWKAPLEKSLKILLLFNYFFLYEFGVISRSYSVGIFLTFFYVGFCDSSHKNLQRLSFVALLLSPQVSIYSLIVSSALFIPHFLQQMTVKYRTALFQALLFSASLFLAILQMIPAPDQSLKPNLDLFFDVAKLKALVSLVGETFFYIPNLPAFPNIWNTSFTLLPIFKIIRALLALGLFGAFTYFIYKKRPSLAISLSIGTTVLLCFAFFVFMGSYRHLSHILLMMLAFYWLAQKKKTTEPSASTVNILKAVFAISVCSGILNYFADVMIPFSDAKNASKVLSPTDKLVVGIPDYAVSSVSGFSGGREIYYLNSNRVGTFVKWNHKKEEAGATFKEAMLAAFEKYNVDEAVLVSSLPQINEHMKRVAGQDLLYESLACIVPDECFQVYRIRKKSVLEIP